MSTAIIDTTRTQPAARWWEIFIVMAVTVVSLSDARLKPIGILVPVLYLIIEARLRHRNLTEMGFNFKRIPADLLHSLGWVLLVGVGTQSLVLFGTKWLAPAFFTQFVEHVLGRSPIDLSSMINASLVVALLVAALGEEIIFRGLFQKRLSVFLPVWAAIGLTSLLFAGVHFNAGPLGLVAFDLGMIMLDSIIYGVIMWRTNNVFVAWIAHFLANFTAVILLAAIAR